MTAKREPRSVFVSPSGHEEPLQRGHVVSYNLFHYIGLNRTIAGAVYIDRCSMGISVLRNLFVRICGDGSRFRRAIYANGASHLTVAENLLRRLRMRVRI